MSTHFAIGDRIKGIFRVETILEGGMGVIYICETVPADEMPHSARYPKTDSTGAAEADPQPSSQQQEGSNLRHPVVFKTFHKELLWHKSVSERFQREGLVWVTLLPHPHVIRARTIDRLSTSLLLMLDFADGGNLRDCLALGRLEAEQVLAISIQFCLGMEFIYESARIIHRDIKPENILLMQDGTVKVTDFGLAKAVGALNKQSKDGDAFDFDENGGDNEDNGTDPDAHVSDADADDAFDLDAEVGVLNPQLTRHGVIVGTVPYMSPEQFRGDPLDVQSDVYSFGVVLYEMFAGHLPFQSPTYGGYRKQHLQSLPAIIRDIPQALWQICLSCLEKDPSLRFSNFTTVREALEIFCTRNHLEHLIRAKPRMEELEAQMESIDWTLRGYALPHLLPSRDEDYLLQESYRCYQKAHELDPMNYGSNTNLATGLKRLGRLDEALPYFEKEVELHPDLAIAYVPLAGAYWELGRKEEALAATRRSAELEPEGVTLWRAYGRMAKRSGLLEESRRVNEHIKKLLATVPLLQNAISANNEAVQSIQMGDLETAIEMHEFAVKHYPDSPESWYNFGVSLQTLRQSGFAIKCYSRAIQLNPGMTFALFNRGILLSESPDVTAARKDFQAAIASDPEHNLARVAYVFLLDPERFKEMGSEFAGSLGLQYIL